MTVFPQIVLTGDRPTGRLHLGHYVGSLKNRIALQDRSDISERYYMVADIQALTDNYDNPQKVRDNLYQVVIDNLAVGLDADKTNIFVQSMVPEIAELTIFFLNLVSVNRLLENPTVRTEIQQKGWATGKIDRVIKGETTAGDIDTQGVPAGFLVYPVSQAADIYCVRGNVVPVGADQRPMIEQANEIGSKFNNLYGVEVFPYITMIEGEIARLVGTDGNAKMSKSLGNTVYLSDTRDEISKKVTSMYTCPSKVSVSDVVSMDEMSRNVVFQYLDIFDTDHEGVLDLKQRYMEGQTGDMEGKRRLLEILDGIIAPIRSRRHDIEKNMDIVENVVRFGTERARDSASRTLTEVRRAMKIAYFD